MAIPEAFVGVANRPIQIDRIEVQIGSSANEIKHKDSIKTKIQ
jgi:hypothetical protein